MAVVNDPDDDLIPSDELRSKFREEDDRIAAIIAHKEKSHRRIGIAQLAAYLLLVAMIIYTWSGFEEQNRARCDQGQTNRESLKGVVIAIEELGTALVLGSNDPSTPTPEQQESLRQFQEFKERQLKVLAQPVCPDVD